MSTFTPAYPHGELEEVFSDIFFVTGTVVMKGPVSFAFSRNMIVLRSGESLTIVNSMRLDDEGLAKLDKLGKVENVIRLAGFHGMDDPFYKDRYGAKVWVAKGHVYAKGFDNTKTKAEDGYFAPDVTMDASTELPVPGAQLIVFDCIAGEGILRLDRDGGILITGDSLQNWQQTDRFFNFPAKLFMKVVGFIKAHNLGPGWIKQAKPKKEQVKALLDLEFEHLLPGHGEAVKGDAKEKFRPAIERL